MVSPASRNLAARAPARSGSEARLALTERLLATSDLAPAVQAALAWLERFGGVRHSLCAAVDGAGKRLLCVAGWGVSPARAAELVIDLEQASHPLVDALGAQEPLLFLQERLDPPCPLEGPFQALPLRPRHEGGSAPAIGLLLCGAPRGRCSDEAVWLAGVLGDLLGRGTRHASLAETQFGRERSLLYGIINAVTDPILLTDPGGKLVLANAHAEKLFTSPENASEGRRRAVALNNMLFSAALFSRTVDTPETSRRELLLVDPMEGTDLLFELLSTQVVDPREGAGVVSILRNVTDLGKAMVEIEENYQKLRLTETEVRAERHRLDLIIDSVADPIVVSDASGDIMLMNDPAERFLTAPMQAADGVWRRVRANEANFTSFVSNLLFSGSELRWRGEMTLVEPASGTPQPVEAVSGKVLGEKGEITAVVTILHDRTEAIENARLYAELKRGAEELAGKVEAATAELAHQNELLRRQHMELEQASQLKTQFLANMSHEFRTPLNAVLGYTNMLLQGIQGKLTPGQRKALGRVDSNARHLLSLINDILDISRIEAGRMPLHLEEFELGDLLREVMSELEAIIGRSRLDVSTDHHQKIPALRTDRKKIKQIVVNLLSNALKFTHQGSIRIRAAYSDPDRMVRISVADTGIGIGEADLERVFDDFRQLDNSPTRAYGGTGLGLSICRRLAHMLGGKVTLESKLGRGSTFTLHVPPRLKRR